MQCGRIEEAEFAESAGRDRTKSVSFGQERLGERGMESGELRVKSDWHGVIAAGRELFCSPGIYAWELARDSRDFVAAADCDR